MYLLGVVGVWLDNVHGGASSTLVASGLVNRLRSKDEGPGLKCAVKKALNIQPQIRSETAVSEDTLQFISFRKSAKSQHLFHPASSPSSLVLQFAEPSIICSSSSSIFYTSMSSFLSPNVPNASCRNAMKVYATLFPHQCNFLGWTLQVIRYKNVFAICVIHWEYTPPRSTTPRNAMPIYRSACFAKYTCTRKAEIRASQLFVRVHQS